MTKNRRGKTRSKTQRGGVWYNPLTWFESDPYKTESSSIITDANNFTTGAVDKLTNARDYVANTVSAQFSSSPDNATMPTTEYRVPPSQPYSGGKHRRKRRHSKTKKGGKGGLGLTYYATPVSGANVAQPTTLQFYENGTNQYSISGGSKRRKSRKSCKTRRRHKKH
jgi:hypothetical protein